MLRRLHPDQPASFAFTPENLAWAQAQITKYPEGRQASAIIPLLWRAQEQEGWLTRPAIECVADMLGLAHIRALEVATFYFMFQLQPVGAVAHIQICGTLSCMICGAEDLIAVCREKIAPKAHQLSADGKFSWEEVECLGACANAPMAQIGKDYYEDLTAEKLATIIDEMAAGRVPTPGPQNGRYAAEPLGGPSTLTDHVAGRDTLNASARLATDIGDTIKRIDGTEVPLLAPWGRQSGGDTALAPPRPAAEKARPTPARARKAAPPAPAKPATPAAAKKADKGAAPATVAEAAPAQLSAPRGGAADDLKKISGVGPKLAALLNEMGFWHFDQIAAWTPAEVAWVDARLKFKGRIERDDWITQAATLAAARG
ncbi:NADH-quinone oxidoreductase subunit E [Roseicyclus sp.]|uniref:NADH-quinone oxidoreductase subunit E n=1 Tax=Roseicyclus sp. TaxID=1914329 RepID=UPI003F6D0FAD